MLTAHNPTESSQTSSADVDIPYIHTLGNNCISISYCLLIDVIYLDLLSFFLFA